MEARRLMICRSSNESGVNGMFVSVKQRVSKNEEACFRAVLDKLSGMSDGRRRGHRCWKAMRHVLELTGNWKRSPRGKPMAKNLTGPPTCPDADLNGDV